MTAEFEKLIKQLGEVLYRIVDDNPSLSSWSLATLDVRFEQSGLSWLTKVRVSLQDGQTKSAKITNELDLILILLNPLRSLFADTWHGLLLRVERTGKCFIDYDYSPNCSQDPSFFNN